MSIEDLVQMDLFGRLGSMRRGHCRVSNNDGRPIGPLRPHRLDTAQTTRGVVENEIVTHNDAGVGGEWGEERHQQDVTDLNRVIENRSSPFAPEHLVEVQTLVLPEAARPRIVAEIEAVILRKVAPDDRVAVLLSVDVGETDQVMIVRHSGTQGDNTRGPGT